MDDVNVLNLVVRILHITGAMVVLGGSIFARFALLPSMRALPTDARAGLRDDVRRRFLWLFMLAATALLISGFYNYLHNESPAHSGQSLYHALMGTKIILSLAVFILGSALLGRAAAFDGLRKKAATWMAVNIFLALIIVVLAALLRVLPETSLGAA
jgi:uncharacterized membrane protein